MTVPANARANETLDAICWRVLGTTAGHVVEAAYELNRNLADIGVVLPEGTPVILPEAPKFGAAILETVSLWD
ncbi:phage tail protein [Sphingomonas sp. S-NIH.Pt3_0716]|nr:phage tail protein [Sphingomonas sp. S-NIH.Pt3_0716]